MGGAARDNVPPRPPVARGRGAVKRGGRHHHLPFVRELGPLAPGRCGGPCPGWSTRPGTSRQNSGPSAPTTHAGVGSGAWARARACSSPRGPSTTSTTSTSGAGTMVGPYTSIRRGWCRDRRCPPIRWCRIGSRCIIGRGSHIVGHWSIEIGDDIQTGPYVYITDQNHTYEDPVEPIGRQWPTEARSVSARVAGWGPTSSILPGAQIGEHVVVAAGAVVRGVIPDRCVVAGVPAESSGVGSRARGGSTRRTSRSEASPVAVHRWRPSPLSLW